MLSAAVVIHSAAVVSKLILFLYPLAELLIQNFLCSLYRGLGHHGPEILNLKVQAGAADTWRSLVIAFAVEFKDVGRNKSRVLQKDSFLTIPFILTADLN